MANFFDLNPTQTKSTDGKYIDLVFTGFVPDTEYGLTFAWVYEDDKLGVSEESNIFGFTTISEPELSAPYFIADNLYAKNSILYISWNGKNAQLQDYSPSALKQVNIWIKGGDFGTEFVKYATSFTKAGTVQISTTTKATYTVKLQAEANSGILSPFSSEFSVTLLKQPKAATNLQTAWVSDDLNLTFDFDSTFVDSTNDNRNADVFLITFYANSKEHTFYQPVNKSTTSQKFTLERNTNVAYFDLFAKQLTVFIQVKDIYGQVSTIVEHTSVTYTTPLDAPVISGIAETLAYSILWNSQAGKPLDSIYIYEDTGSGYVQVAQGTTNPIRVSTTDTLTRSVKAKFYDINSESTAFSNIISITPTASVVMDSTAPSAPSTLTGTAGLDTTGSIGFNGYLSLSWTAVSDTTLRGYRIRFRPYKSTEPYEDWSYVDSPGTGTTYRLGGLAVGTTYEVGIASFDDFNNTSSSYTASSNLTVSGTPFIGTNVTTTGYFAANSGNDVGTFKFGYGVETGKRGLKFNDNNYWYIDSNASALFKLGGDEDNYIQWNGTTFIVQGDLRAKKGNFSGNVEIKSGGSLFSGAINAGGTDITGAGFILNNTGLKFNSATVSDITTISGTTGKLTTKLATIGGWDVNDSTISKNGISLDSTGKIIANNSAYYVGIKPSATLTDVVLWAGQSALGSDANFRVTATGKLYATGAVITGDITLDNGSGLSNLINSKAKIYRQNDEPTGGTYLNGDLWIDTNDNNKVYSYNSSTSQWVLSQDSATALATANTAKDTADTAKGTADTAKETADTAAGKAQKFDFTTGNLITGLTLSSSTASIYSTKTSYTDTTNGWYLGWKQISAGNFTPALYLGGSTTYLKYATDTGLEVKGDIKATSGSFDGNVTAGAGAITIGPSGISTSSGKFSIDTAGNAYFSGTLQAGTILSQGTVSGSTITGSVINTNAGDQYLGWMRLNGPTNSLEFLNSSNSVTGKMYSFAGTEVIIQYGSDQALGYPKSTGYISLSSLGTTIGRTNANGSNIGGLTVTNTDAQFSGVNVSTIQGAPIGDYNYYMRNIGMGTGAKSTTATDGYRGDIWIQYS